MSSFKQYKQKNNPIPTNLNRNLFLPSIKSKIVFTPFIDQSNHPIAFTINNGYSIFDWLKKVKYPITLLKPDTKSENYEALVPSFIYPQYNKKGSNELSIDTYPKWICMNLAFTSENSQFTEEQYDIFQNEAIQYIKEFVDKPENKNKYQFVNVPAKIINEKEYPLIEIVTNIIMENVKQWPNQYELTENQQHNSSDISQNYSSNKRHHDISENNENKKLKK